jgi:hypothetical protein
MGHKKQSVGVGVSRILHQHNLRQNSLQHNKRIKPDETLTFDDLMTPRCESCGADLEQTLFGLECKSCKERKA